MNTQGRLRPVCASAQSNQSLCRMLEEALCPLRQTKPQSDRMAGQADLNFCGMHVTLQVLSCSRSINTYPKPFMLCFHPCKLGQVQVSWLIKFLLFFTKIPLCNANSVIPDQMPQNIRIFNGCEVPIENSIKPHDAEQLSE